jgi:hypothetical protein
MNKRIMLVSILAILIIAVSGCTDPDNTPPVTIPEEVEASAADLIVLKNVPDGFEYLGAPPTTIDEIKREYVDFPGIVDAAEGIYQSDDFEVSIIVSECEDKTSAEEMLDQYKSGFSELPSGTRFAEESFNGHSATRIKDYGTFNGDQAARYTYAWNNESFVFIVEGNSDDYASTRMIAEATGY